MAAPGNPFVGATYGSALRWLADEYGSREALVFGGERYTFADVKRRVDEASRRFEALGLRPGDRVALWLPNRPEFLWCWLGASQIGLITVVLNTRLKLPEVRYQLAQSDSIALIIPGRGSFRDFPAEIAQLCPEVRVQPAGELTTAELPGLRHIVTLDAGPDWPGLTEWPPFGREADAAASPAYASDPDEPALISYSSGTTALPKGALITHCVWRKAFDIGERVDLTCEDRLYLCIPLFGSMAMMNGVLPFWARGASVILAERFEVREFLRDISSERCTATHFLPPMVESLVASSERAEFDLSRLRIGWVLSNERRILEMVAHDLAVPGMMTGYGLTETTTVLTRNRWDDPLETRITTQGYALPDVELRVVDPETARDVATGETGEIWARGYCITPGYFRKPEESSKALTPDGWFRTGDGGSLDKTGRLTFSGRIGDGYKSRGFNVSPAEIEAALMAHPDVEAAAVVGVAHPRWGQVGIAFVVPAEGRAANPAELAKYLKPRLSSFKLPELIERVSELPLTAGTGKVQKFVLRAEGERLLAGRLAAASG
ncbi:acyl--CoA ligase [Bradyrhizobium lablabi]|uniref:class I adenylate-forming enzyme family protein n=1 Tax=Bradyrhizobium lablabi TaxID=722472 RepID=UPI001BAD3DF6|nr:class I adenylate-forming enzyme family protein [Bradyrhizobium lablabi]MBR1124854.1 acyl--CoA ligase [Bradyrhizobium lablabi]